MRSLKYKLLIVIGLMSVFFSAYSIQIASAASLSAAVPLTTFADTCGGGSKAVTTSIDIGCQGKGNPIADATFAIIRVLSVGVGLVLTASLIFAGIQYSSSRGNPQETAKAIARIQANVVALIIFVFGYAILNYLIPAGFLK